MLLAAAALFAAIPVSSCGAADDPVSESAESVAGAATKPVAGSAGTDITLSIRGNPRRVDLLKKLTVNGALTGAVPSDNVFVEVTASGQDLFKKKISPKSDG